MQRRSIGLVQHGNEPKAQAGGEKPQERELKRACSVSSNEAEYASALREGNEVAKPSKPTAFGLVQATRERHLLCPSADVFHSNAERRLALCGTRQTANQATGEPASRATGRKSGKPTAMSAKTTQDLQQRSDAVMASVPTSRQTASARTKRLAARQVSIRCERRWGRQRQLKAQAHLATERRARQTERCPAYSENRLCRGKPHGRRQGGKDLASDRGRCATLPKQREARNVTGRRLNKPLSTGSKRTLDVERSQRKFARTWRNFGHGEQGSAGQRGLSHASVGGARNLRKGRRLTISALHKD